MKRMILALCAAAVACAFDAMGTSAEDWYSPDNGNWNGNASGEFTVFDYYLDEEGVEQLKTDTMKISDDGTVAGWNTYIAKLETEGLDPVTKMALEAAKNAAENSVKIENMAGRLNRLASSGVKIRLNAPGGGTYEKTISFVSGYDVDQLMKDGTTPILNDETQYGDVIDGKSLTWTKSGATGQVQIKDANKTAAEIEGKIIVAGGNGAVGWVAPKDYLDNESIAAEYISNHRIKNNTVRIKGWDNGGPDAECKLSDVLGGNKSDLESAKVMVRVIESSKPVMKYAAIGKMGDSFAIDLTSVTTNKDDGAKANGTLSIIGAYSAGEAGKDYYLTRNGTGENNTLSWTVAPGTNSFSTAAFTVKDDKTVTLKAMDDVGSSDSGVATEVAGQLTWKKPSANSQYFGTPDEGNLDLGFYKLPAQAEYDNVSVFSNDEGKVEIKGWKTIAQGAQTTYKIADIMQGDESEHENDYLIVRGGDSTAMNYVRLGNLGKHHMTDETSITTNRESGAKANGTLSIIGAYSAGEAGKDYYLTRNGTGENNTLEWKQFSATNSFSEKAFTVSGTGNTVKLLDMDDAEGGTTLYDGVATERNGTLTWMKPDAAKTANCAQYFGTTKGSRELGFYDIQTNKYDNKSIDLNDDGEIQINGWDSGTEGQSFTLADVLADRSGSAESPADGKIIVRTEVNNKPVINYMRIGELGVFGTDEVSVTTNAENGAVYDGELSLYGFQDAENEMEDVTDEYGMVPYSNGGGTLNWGAFSEFFSDTVFSKTSDGKIILNGVDEEGDSVRVVSVRGNGDDQAVSTITFDGASIDGNIDTSSVIQMHNFSTAPSPYVGANYNFADALTNDSASIQGLSVVVRAPAQTGSQIYYVPMGKIASTFAGGHSVDNLSISTNGENNAVQIAGWKDGAETTQASLADMIKDGGYDGIRIPYRAADKTVGYMRPGWFSMPVDDATISTNETDHVGELAIVGAYESDNANKYLMCKDGGGVQWTSVNASNGVAKVDNVTISTNETDHVGEIAIKGAYSASNKDKVLTSTGSGMIWKTPEGSALRVYTDGKHGSSGDITVGGGSVTNVVKLASEDDTNAKFTVSKVNDEIVIKLGVYYLPYLEEQE